MKKVIQLLLFSLLIILSFFFYFNYLKDNEDINKIDKKLENENLSETQNNLIKNLKYEVKFDNNTEYIITAESSELIYENDIEIVKMKKVKAKFIDHKNLPLEIESENAKYNNSNYNTEFSKNVVINYKDNVIKSKNLDLNFVENIVSIYNDVIYESLAGLVKTDNIKIDLTSKKINIFMNDNKKNVELISK